MNVKITLKPFIHDYYVFTMQKTKKLFNLIKFSRLAENFAEFIFTTKGVFIDFTELNFVIKNTSINFTI